MQVVVRRAVVALVGVGERNLVQELAVVEAPEFVLPRLDAHLVERFAQSQLVEHLDRIRALLDTGTELGELRRLLEDMHFEAALQEAGGGGEPTEARTGDEDLSRHGCPPPSPHRATSGHRASGVAQTPPACCRAARRQSCASARRSPARAPPWRWRAQAHR